MLSDVREWLSSDVVNSLVVVAGVAVLVVIGGVRRYRYIQSQRGGAEENQ